MPHPESRNGQPSRNGAQSQGRARQRALMVAAVPAGDDPHLAELEELLRTAGVAAVGELVQRRDRPHPNSYLGPGKLDDLKAEIAARGREPRRLR